MFFQFGQDVLFDCHVDVDPRWNNTLKVNWLKEEKELNLTKLAYDQSIDELEENQRFVNMFLFCFVFENNFSDLSLILHFDHGCLML